MDTLLSLVPVKYVALATALKMLLDALIRMVPDKYWAAHTTEEALRNVLFPPPVQQ